MTRADAPGAPVLEIDRVTKTFNLFRAVDAMTLSVESGAVHALIGPNGAGKSTLINLVSGVLRPDAGEIRFKGRTLLDVPVHAMIRHGIARSFQITSIFPGFSVLENVQAALLASRRAIRNPFRPARRLMRDEAQALLATVRIEPLAGQTAGELAAGDRKRLEFAIALAGDPELMLLDEPTAGMAPSERAVVIEIIRDLNRRKGITVLFTEHDMDMVFSVAQRITVMHQGARLAEGSPQEVRADPRVGEVYLGGVSDARV